MLKENKEVFDNFRKLHADYSLDEDKYQEEFNKQGEKILALIHEWENKLCKQSEKAGYANFTTKLAEKFQSEVKKEYPLIDHVGIVVKNFSLPRIKLS
ncbi:hypothetical protein ACFL1Q_02760 [Patescibacteria group bacterium]